MNQAYELFCRIHPKRKTATSLGKGLGISPVRSQSQNNEVAKDRFQVEAENSLDFDSFNELMSSIMLHEDGIGKVQQQQTKPIPMIQLQNFAKRKTSDPGLNYYHKYPDIKSIVKPKSPSKKQNKRRMSMNPQIQSVLRQPLEMIEEIVNLEDGATPKIRGDDNGR